MRHIPGSISTAGGAGGAIQTCKRVWVGARAESVTFMFDVKREGDGDESKKIYISKQHGGNMCRG
jgi:hypothetical protein